MFVLWTSNHAASPQTLEFQGYISNPSEGPYNQVVFIRVQIINKDIDPVTKESIETVKWEKTFRDTYIHNGQFQVYLNEDDTGRKISSISDDGGVFQNNVEYSFDGAENRNLIDRAVYPDSSYAVRIFIKRTDSEEWERIKPDYNIDGSPYAISSVGLTGYDNKKGQLTVTSSSSTPDSSKAIIEVDTIASDNIESSYRRLQQQHGAYLQNTTLKIDMPEASDNLAFDINGSLYAQNSEMTLGFGGIGDTILEEGNIIFNSLCMAEYCDAAGATFNGELLAYRSVQFARFEDSDDPLITRGFYAGTRYVLDPSGQTTFKSLDISNLSTNEFPFTLRFANDSKLKTKGNAGLVLGGDSVELRFNAGGIKMDLAIDNNGKSNFFTGFDPFDFSNFRMQYDGDLSKENRFEFKSPDFFKLAAGKLLVPNSNPLPFAKSNYFVQPSGLSKMRALQFHFPEKNLTKDIINQRVMKYRFTNNFANRKVDIVFDPVLTEEILNQLLSGEIFNMHHHDLISQASPEDLIEIINDPQYVDPKFITYPNIDPDLAKLPTQNTWLKLTRFGAALENLFEGSSFVLMGEVIASYGLKQLPTENNIDRVKVTLGVSEERNFAYMGSYNQFTQNVELRNPIDLLNVSAGSLNIFGSLEVKSPTSGAVEMNVQGEVTAYTSLLVENDFKSNGTQMFGCFHESSNNPCPEVSVVRANSISNAYDIGASVFIDADDPNYYFDPDQDSNIQQLKIKENLNVNNTEFEITDSLHVFGTLNASNVYVGNATGAYIESISLLTKDTNLFSDPNNESVWQNLHVKGELDIENGSIEVIGKTTIAGQITAESALVSLNSTITQKIIAPKFVDIDDDTKILDPDNTSNFHELGVESSIFMNGDLSINGNLTQNNSKMIIQGNLDIKNTLKTKKFIDYDKENFGIDPSSTSVFRDLIGLEWVDTQNMTAGAVNVNSGIMKVKGSAHFDQSLSVDNNTVVTGELRQYIQTGVPVFEVYNDVGKVKANSVKLSDSLTVSQEVDLATTLTVDGTLSVYEEIHLQNLDLEITDSLKFEDKDKNQKFLIDSSGNISSSGGLQATGDIRFLTESGRGLLASTQWMLATENPAIRDLEFKRSDGLFLDLASDNLTSQTTDASSKNFEITSFTTAQRIIDSDNSSYEIELYKMAKLKNLSVKSDIPVVVAQNPVRISTLNDLNDPRYKYDPSSLSHTKDLTVDQTAIFRHSLTIEPNTVIPTNSYDTKLSFQKSLTSSNETLLKIDNSFALSRMGHLTSSLDYFQQGSMEIIDSVLILGETGSEVSIGKLTMTTLIIKPAITINTTHQANFPAYFADHLHHHAEVADIDGKQFARKSEDNIFLGENRFVSSANAVTLSPSLTSAASWINTNTTNLDRYAPFILPRDQQNKGFFVAHGYTDPTLNTVKPGVVSFSAENLNFSAYSDDGSQYLRAMHLSIDPAADNIYLSGGLHSSNGQPTDKLYINGASKTVNLPKGIAYHQSVAFKDNLYAFGGVTSNSNGLTYPNTQSFIGDPNNIVSYSSNLPSQNILHNDSVLYIKGNSIYRNSLALDDEELVYQHSENIFAPQVSPTGLEICFHTATKKLLLYSLVTRAGPITIQDPGHHCQWGQNGKEDYIFFINSNSTSGPLARDNRKGDDLKVFDGTDLSPNLTPLAIRDLHIADNGSVSAIGTATLEGFAGERIVLKKSDNSIEAVDSDGANSSQLLSSAINASHPQIYANQLYYVSSAASSNNTNNLFLADTDGSFKKQLSFIPQGIQNRPVLLDDGDALVAIKSNYQKSRLPSNYRRKCSAYYDNNVYLFGTEGSSNVAVYDTLKDSFSTLPENIPFATGNFSCADDGQGKAYFYAPGTGALENWDAKPTSGVLDIQLSADGTELYVGANGPIGTGVTASHFAKLNTTTAQAIQIVNSDTNFTYRFAYDEDTETFFRYRAGDLLEIGGPNNTLLKTYRNTGVIESITFDDASVYVGGNFQSFTTSTANQNLAILSPDNPEPLYGGFASSIINIEAATNGEWFIRTNSSQISRISSTGQILWTANPGSNNAISYDQNSDILYVATRSSKDIQRINGSTGNLLATTAINFVRNYVDGNGVNQSYDSYASSLAIGPNHILYAVGDFSHVNGEAHQFICAIDMSTGEVADWNPSINNYSSVKLLPNSAGTKLFLGGYFQAVNNTTHRYLAVLDTSSGALIHTTLSANGNVSALAFNSDESILYVGGGFTQIGGVNRNRIAAIDTSDMSITDWNPNADSNVYDLSVSHNDELVYAAGNFLNIGGREQRYLAALDTSFNSNQATTWSPKITRQPSELAASSNSSKVNVVGSFKHLGAEVNHARYFARFSRSTGALIPTSIQPNGQVYGLKYSSQKNQLYIGGSFSKINDISRNKLAAIDLDDFSLSDWDPNADTTVNELELNSDESILYLGGSFSSVGGKTRQRLAAVDPISGSVLDWAPQASSNVYAISVDPDDQTIYVGGFFTSLNGVGRNRIAAISAQDGSLLDWNPDANNSVQHLEVSPDGETIYAAGNFTVIAGRSRNYLAAIKTQIVPDELHYFDMAQGRFWEAPTPPNLGNETSISYYDNKLYVLESTDAIDSNFMVYDVNAGSWSNLSQPAGKYKDSQLITKGDSIYLLGNTQSTTNRIYNIASNSWSDGPNMPKFMHDLHAFNETNDTIIFFGGSLQNEVYRYDTAANSITQITSLAVNVENAGSYYDGNQQLYVFGGENDPDKILIHPLNAPDSNDFSQIMRVNLQSGELSYETSAPYFVNAARSPASSDVVYFDQDNGLLRYNPADKTHSTVLAPATADAVTGISITKENDWVYFSNLESGSETIYRVKLDGSDLENLSSGALNGVTGTVSFVSEDHERLYYTNNGEVFKTNIGTQMPAVKIGTYSAASQLAYHSSTSVSERREGLLFTASSTDFSSITTQQFEYSETDQTSAAVKGPLILEELHRDKSGNYIFSARRHFATTNLFYLEDGSSEPEVLTAYSGTEQITEPFYNDTDDAIYFNLNNQSVKLSGSLTSLTNASARDYNFDATFTPKAHRNRSFLYDDAVYTLLGNQLYKSQTLSGTPAALSWTAHQTLPQINGSDWQITQYRNRIFFFDERSKTIYRYHPDDFSLESKGVIQTTISSGSLAVTSDAFYYVGSGSVSKMALLTKPDQNLSVEVYSAADSNVDSTAIQIMSFDPSGRFFGRRLQGTADFDDQTVSGGPGDLGIEDRSLASADLKPNAIVTNTIKDSSIERRHFFGDISETKIANESLNSELFRTGIIFSNHIKDREIDTHHLGLSTFESSKLSDLGFTNADFADESIQNENLKTNTISGDQIKDDTIVAANIKSLTLLNEDFADYNLGSKQFLDGSIAAVDIATETIIERHFIENSVTTEKILASAVTTDKIRDFTLTTEKFLDYTIETSDLATESITGGLMLSEALESRHFVDDTNGIATDHLSSSSITWEKIANNAIDRSKVATGTVTSNDIATKTITNRELATGSITTNNIIDNSLENYLISTDAIKAEKLATNAISEEDIANSTIINRHFFSGGKGGIQTITVDASAVSFGNRVRPAMAVYENQLYVLGGGISGGFKINLASKATETVTALTDFPSNSFNSAYASNNTTLYLLDQSILYGFDFNSESYYQITSLSFEGSADTSMTAFLSGGKFYVAGGSDTHKQKLHSHDLSIGGSWTPTNLPMSISLPAVVSDSTSVYLFGNGKYLQSSTPSGSWTSGNLTTSYNLEGAAGYYYKNEIYLLGGETDSKIHKFNPSSSSLTELNTQAINIGASSSNQLISYLHRAYIPSFSGTNKDKLLIWHPTLDASIQNRHIHDNAVVASKIKTASLETINFAINSIDSDRIKDGEVKNADIENNVLTDHSIDELIFDASHFKYSSITSAKLATQSVNSDIIKDGSLKDSDFDTDAIDSEALANDSVDSDAVATYAITDTKIESAAITLDKVDSGVITATHVKDSEITTEDIATRTITNGVIAPLNIRSRHIKHDEILSRHIKYGAISRSKIANSSLKDDVFAVDAFDQETMVQDLAVQDKHVASKNITHDKITTDLTKLLVQSKFTSESLTSADLATGAIREVHIDDLQITNSRIQTSILEDRSFADNAILTNHLIDGLLTSDQFAEKTLKTTDFANRSLISNQFAVSSINSIHIISLSLHSDDFESGSIGDVISLSSISSIKVKTNDLLAEDWDDDSVNSDAMSTDSVLGIKVKTNVIQSAKIDLNQITRIKLKANSFVTEDLADSSLDKNSILSFTLGGEHLEDNSLDVANRMDDSSIEGLFVLSGVLSESKIQNDSIDSDSIGDYQIVTRHIVDLSILSEDIADNAVDKMKLATKDVFNSDNIIDESIRGESIVSFSLENAQLRDNAIREDLIKDDVINAFSAVNVAGVTFDASTASITGTFGHVQPIGDKFYTHQQGADKLQSTTDFSSMTTLGNSPCSGDSINAFYFYNAQEGFTACNNKQLYLTEDSAQNWKTITGLPEIPHLLHFFDRSNGYLMTKTGTQERLWESTDGGLNWTSKFGPNDNFHQWEIHRNTMVIVESDSSNQNTKFHYTKNAGSSWTSTTMTTDYHYGLAIDPETEDLWGIHRNGSDYKIVKYQSYGPNHDVKVSDAIITNLLNDCKPGDWTRIVNGIFYAFSTSSGCGPIYHKISSGETFEVTGSSIQVNQPSDTGVGYLAEPIYLGESKFLVRNASNNYLTWQINQYEHIKDASLTSDSLNTGAITTNYWQFRSIDNSKFDIGSIANEHIDANSFTHGKYVLKQINTNDGFLAASSFDGGKTIIAINDGTNTDKVYKSTNGGGSFSQIFDASGDVLQTIHGRGKAIIIGTTGKNLIISKDQGASFTKITSTPFSSDVRVGYAFDANNFLVIGKNSKNQLIPAEFNAELSEFQTLKNSSNQPIEILSSSNSIYGWDMDFVSGSTGYLSVKRHNIGAVIYKTTNHGYSWSGLLEASTLSASTQNSKIQVFEDGKFYVVNADNFYEYSADSQSSILTFPAGVGNATAMHFVSTDIGFVAFDSGQIYASYDGGSSFEQLATLGSTIHDIVQLSSSKLMLTGTGVKTYQLAPQFDHYPIKEITNSDLATSFKLQSAQIEARSLSVDDLSDGSITEEALAEASLKGSKLADSSISQQKIKDRTLDKFLFELNSLSTAKFTTDGIHGDQFHKLIITTELIKNGTIGSAELSGSNLSSGSLDDDAITTDIIQDESLYGEILTDKAIQNSHLNDESFTEYEFADGVFGDQNFVENSIQREHLLTPDFNLEENSIELHILTKAAMQNTQINSRLISDESIFGFNILTGVITESKINGAIVTEGKWQDDSIIGSLLNNQIISSLKVKDNHILGSHFISDTISRSKYDDTSIPSEKIASLTITNRELADDSVIAGKLSTESSYLLDSSKFDSKIVSSGNLSGTFSEAAFGDEVFTSTRIADRVVTNIKMTEDFLTASHFMDESLLNEDFENNSITANHLVVNNNYADKLADNSITHDRIASHTLTNLSIQPGIIISKFNNAIIFAEQLGTISQTKLANDAIRAIHIKKYSLKAANFANNAFEAEQFMNGSIVGPNLADNVIVIDDMNNAQLTRHHFKDGSLLNEDFKGEITGSKIASDTLTGGEFVDEFLLGTNVVTKSITESKFASSTLGSREIKNAEIITRHLADKTFTDETRFADNSVDLEDIDDLQITSSVIKDGTITSQMIDSASLTGDRIKDGEIVADDIEDEAIISRILGSNIPQDRLVDNSIEKTKLNTSYKIAANKFRLSGIHNAKVATGAISSSKLVTNSIDGSKFATDINGSRIADSQILSSHLTGSPLTSDYLADNSITESAIGAGVLTNIHFADGVIQTADLKDSSISIAKIADFAINSDSISNGSIETSDIQNGAITNADINDYTLTNTRFDLNDIKTENVVDGSLKWSNLANNALINVHFEDSVITTAMISDSTIDLAHLTSGVSGFEIKDGDLTAAKFDAEIPGSKFKTGGISFDSVPNSIISSLKYALNIPSSKIASAALTEGKFDSFTFSRSTSSTENGAIETHDLLGGSDDDFVGGAAADGNDFLVFGSTASSAKATSTTRDAYVIKLSSTGQVIWEYAFGGNGNEEGFRAMTKHSSNYIFVGKSNSTASGQITSATKGNDDLHIMAINSNGSKQWDKNYGGKGSDGAYGIDLAIGSGLIVAGYSSDLSTDSAFVAQNNGKQDAWLVKTDANGAFEWENNYGGSNNEIFKAVRKTVDNGYLAAGFSDSALAGNHGNKDMYLVKTDSSGELLWQKLLGGSSEDEFHQMIKTSDDGFLAVGYSKSNNGDIAENAGKKDAIIFKFDSEGETVWSTVIGGNEDDEAYDAVELADGSYSVGISSQSSANGDFIESSKGDIDFWIFKLSASGKLIWRKNYGGSSTDNLRGLAVNSGQKVLLAGFSDTTSIGVQSNNGKKDVLSIILKRDSIIKQASIGTDDFLDNTIATNRISDRTVQATDITDGNLGATELSGNIVSNQKIADGAITAAKLYDGVDSSKKLSASNFEDGSIDTTKVSENTISKAMLDSTETKFMKIFDLGSGDTETHADGQHYHLSDSNEDCPTGYTDLSGLGFCVRSSDISATTSDALSVCESDSSAADARICSFQEYTSACKTSSQTLSLTADAYYLFASYTTTSILAFEYDSSSSCRLHNKAKAFGFGSSDSIKVRCCITK